MGITAAGHMLTTWACACQHADDWPMFCVFLCCVMLQCNIDAVCAWQTIVHSQDRYIT